MATDQDNLASRLIRARSSRGWSQQDLSKASTVAAAQISRYEQGSNAPRPPVIAKLAAALGVSFDWLMSGSEPSDLEERVPGMRQVSLLLPTDLLRKLEEAAKTEGHTLGQEVRGRLQATFDETVVTTIEARVRPGAEEKRFEFNADEIADRVVAKLSNPARTEADKDKVIIPMDQKGLVSHYLEFVRSIIERRESALGSVLVTGDQRGPNELRGNEPYGPPKSSNAKKRPPKAGLKK